MMRLSSLLAASCLVVGCASVAPLAPVPADAPPAGTPSAPMAIAMKPRAAAVLDLQQGACALALQLEPLAPRQLLASIFSPAQVTQVRVKVARVDGGADARTASLSLDYPVSAAVIRGLAANVTYTVSAELWGLPDATGAPQHQLNSARPASRRVSFETETQLDGAPLVRDQQSLSLPLVLD